MKYTPTKDFRAGGLLGYVEGRVPFSVLVGLFGEPSEADEYKVAFEWTIDFEDGLFARIYDWKETTMYDPEGVCPSEIMDGSYMPEWHIGGEDDIVVGRVNEIVRNAQEKA